MQIAFYGTARHIGTSANMAAVEAGLIHYHKFPASRRQWTPEMAEIGDEIILTDCTSPQKAHGMLDSCDLLVLNLSFPYRGLEEVYFRHSLVRKNVIFLIGKYYQNKVCELEQLAKAYRIPLSRVCTIPYNLRFQKAYENQQVLKYVRNVASYEDVWFETNLKRTLRAIIHYGLKKGDV